MGNRWGNRENSVRLPKKGNAKECSSYLTIALISHASKVMLKILQARQQHLELDMEKQTSSKWEKEYVKAVYCHPAYLNYMQITS